MIEILTILAVCFIVYYFSFRRKKTETKVKENTNIKYYYTDFELELILKINNYRISLGLSSLEVSDYISLICADHNTDMFEQNLASHNGFTDRSQRIIDNLGATNVGENIAYNFLSSDAIIQAWLKSPEHKKNLENPEWNIMGLSTLNKYTTTIFARRT